jgi:spore germination protein KC
MKQKGLSLCLFILLAMLLTGCWNRRELNDLAIAVAIGIDKDGDLYKVSVQVVRPTEIAGKKSGSMSPVTLYQTTGNTILEALRKMTTVSPRKIYLAHLRIMVLGESLAREGMEDALDLMSRDPETRSDFYIIIAKKSNAEDTLRILTNLEKIPAVRLFSSLETSEKAWAPTSTVTLDELVTSLVSHGRQAVLTGIKVQGSPQIGETNKNVNTVLPPAKLVFSGLSVFRKDKLIGWLSEEESKAYNYITNHIDSTVGFVKCPHGGKVSLEIIDSETRVKGSIRDERPQIDIEVKNEINVGEVQCHIDLTKTATVTELENLTNLKLEQLIEETINTVKEKYKVDIFGFGEVIHRSNPKAWKKLKEDWDKDFISTQVHVKVVSKIRHFGKVSNSFLGEKEELLE